VSGVWGRIFDKLLALKGKPVVVIDQVGTRYDGLLQFGEGIIEHFEIVRETPRGRQTVLTIRLITRIMEVEGSTITVDLSKMIDIWSEETMQNELFFESAVNEVKLHESKARDIEVAENETDEGASEENEDGPTQGKAHKGVHYLRPGESIRRVLLTDYGITIWVGNRPAKKRRRS
jgi:hypothetical protein